MRVMLVDENEGRSAILQQALLDAGHEVVARIQSSAEMLQQMSEVELDMVIIDKDSPDQQILAQMSAISQSQPKPIVFFSQQGDGEMIDKAIKAGVSAYVIDGVDGKRIAPIMAVATARFREFQELKNELEETKSTLVERKSIDKAKGILMQKKGMSEDEAYHALRKMAMDKNIKIVEAATQLIAVAQLLN